MANGALSSVTTAQLPLKAEAFNAWSAGQTWFAWCSTTGTAVTMTDSAWIAWNSSVANVTGSLAYNYDTNTAYTYTGAWTVWNTGYQETEDETAAREAAAQRELAAEQTTARSLELLKSLLSDAQWASYQENGWFEVRGSKGGRWRIRNRGQSGNVDLMPEIGDERLASYCAHPPGGLPSADAHAAQMLALVTDEEAFVRTANVHYRRPVLRAA